jgi:hypothetical protein
LSFSFDSFVVAFIVPDAQRSFIAADRFARLSSRSFASKAFASTQAARMHA